MASSSARIFALASSSFPGGPLQLAEVGVSFSFGLGHVVLCLSFDRGHHHGALVLRGLPHFARALPHRGVERWRQRDRLARLRRLLGLQLAELSQQVGDGRHAAATQLVVDRPSALLDAALAQRCDGLLQRLGRHDSFSCHGQPPRQ
nr:hypothetical protein [Ideonella sp. B508-1]